MQLDVDTSAPTLAKVSFTVPRDEFEGEVANGLRSASRQVRMKGFRPGKVPIAVLEKRFGDGVRNEVKERFVQRAYGQALEENSLKPIAHPRLSPEDLELSEDGSLHVEFEVPLRPQFDLPDYRGLTATSELEPVMDEQIDTTLEELRQQQSTPEPAGDDGIDENGFVVGDISFLHEGETVFEREGMRLNGMSVPPGVDGDEFAKGLVGAKEGDTLEFAMTLPDFLENEDVRGKDGQCRIQVGQAMNLVPPTDQALIEIVDGGNEDRSIEDLDALKAFIRERLEEAAQQREDQRIETVLLDQVLDAATMDLPATMVEQQTESRLENLRSQMAEGGQDEEAIEKAVEEARDSSRADAEKGLKALLVVEAIGEKEELLVNNDDMAAELQTIAARNQSTVQEVQEYYSQNNLGQQLAIEILEKKVRRFLRENADIESPS